MDSLEYLLDRSRIVPVCRSGTRKQAILDLAAIAAESLGLDAQEVFEGVMERERLGSTGVGEGVAIPHFRSPNVLEPAGVFARLVDPVDFSAIDDRPCDLIFMLLTPEDAGADHLRALSRVARMFRQDPVRTALRKAQTVDAVLEVLCPNAASDAA